MKVPTGSSVSSWRRVPGVRSLDRRGGSGIGCSRSLPMAVRLAFVRYGMPGISDVYVAPIAGGEPRRRTNWNASISGVSWASDGREILYSVAEAPGLDHSLFRIAADGDRIERGTRALHTSVASLSMSRPRSGQPGRIAFTRSRIDVGLRLVDLEGQRVGDVFQSIGHFSDSTRVDFPGRFSRDGKQVAFLSDQNRVGGSVDRQRGRLGIATGDHASRDGASHRELVPRQPPRWSSTRLSPATQTSISYLSTVDHLSE